MKSNVRVVEPKGLPYRDPYQEIAVYIRELLKCEYALVAVPQQGAIRIQGFAGRTDDLDESVAADVLSRLRDWGPVVVDDARLVAAPVSRGDDVKGVLIGYSPKSGTFTAEDLQKLTAYLPVAAGIFASIDEPRMFWTGPLQANDLLHFFRLITMGEFSACFAHEVRNPLQLIRGHVQQLEESLTPDHPLLATVQAIDRAERRITDMAMRMLDFSKKRTRHAEPCKISELIADALPFVQPHLRSKLIDVQVHADPELPPIQADRLNIVHALVNLLQNAVDAMLAADRRILSINANMDRNELRIVIADTGTGIAPENVSKIFEPFFTTKGDNGTGLGLYITRQVIEEHHGFITVETSKRGTSFTITLPAN